MPRKLSPQEASEIYASLPLSDKIGSIADSVEIRGSDTKLTYLLVGMYLGVAEEALRNGQQSRAARQLKEAELQLVEGDESMANIIGL